MTQFNTVYSIPAGFRTAFNAVKTKLKRYCRLMFLIVASMTLLSACSTKDEFFEGACMGIFNHTQERIETSYVNGTWTGTGDPYNWGGGHMCGVKLPPKWHEGLSVHVKWTYGLVTEDVKRVIDADTIWYEQDVAVPKYKNLDSFYLHFMPDKKFVMSVNLEPKQMPPEWQHTPPPENFRLPPNYYCENIKLYNLTPKQCDKNLNYFSDTGIYPGKPSDVKNKSTP